MSNTSPAALILALNFIIYPNLRIATSSSYLRYAKREIGNLEHQKHKEIKNLETQTSTFQQVLW